MQNEETLGNIANAMVALQYEETLEQVKNALDKEISAQTIILQGLAKGLELVGQKFEEKEFFLAELMMATHIMNAALELLEPILMSTEPAQSSGMLVIGTVKDDVHDIGKNIVATLAKATGIQVHDLGVDTSNTSFIECIRKYKPDIVGMSALLSNTADNMRDLIEELKVAELRDEVFVIIGGGPTSEKFAKMIGADAYASNAIEGIRFMVNYCRTKQEGSRNG